MFEESLLESSHLLRSRNRWPAVASFAFQAAIATLIVMLPLLHPTLLKLRVPETILTAPAPTPHVIPPTPQRVRVDNSTSTVPVTQTAQPTLLSRIIPGIDPNHSSDDPPPTGNMSGMSGNSDNPLASLASTAAATASTHVVMGAKPGPLNVSKGVAAGMLLAPIQPIYPPIAQAAHQQGTVIIHAIISKEGRIESATVVSGPLMLQAAAIEAVRNAHYRPYLLSGQPTEVETTFSINFRLSS